MSTRKACWLGAAFIVSQILALLAPNMILAGKGTLTILHTNDIHSYLDRFPALATRVKEVRETKAREKEPVLLLDSGDFLIGTPYHLLSLTSSPELTLMHTLGYDATTLGNHEFEWGPEALARLIDVARTNGGGSTVPIVASNIEFSLFDSRDDDLKKLYESGAIQPYLVKDLSNGLRVGIIGLLGRDAERETPGAPPIRFRHARDFVQEIVNKVRKRRTDLVVLLSHSGLDEDKKLARSIEGIDVVIAGHCRTILPQPIQIGSTLIVEAGSYARNLGKLELHADDGKVSLVRYELIPIDDNVSKDEAVEKIVKDYRCIIDEQVLNPLGLELERALAETRFDLPAENESSSEINLGNLVTDGMRFAIDRYEPEESVDFAFEPTGFIRDSLDPGVVKTSDAFSTLPLGSGPDMEPGYPLVSFYLNAQEIKRVLEISIYLSTRRGKDYLLQVSGLRFWYSPLGPKFRKVTCIEKWDRAFGRYVPLDVSDTTTLYKVGTNLFLIDILPVIARYLPRLTVIPKDRNKNPIPLETPRDRTQILVDTDPIRAGIQELKEWRALIDYLSHFPDLDRDLIPDVPSRYAELQGRVNRPPENVLSYQAQKKKPWIGRGASLLFPSLGHLYARDWYPRGLGFFLLELGSVSLATREPTRDLGLFGLIFLKAWECGDAHRAVIDYNDRLAEKYNIAFSVDERTASVALCLRF